MAPKPEAPALPPPPSSSIVAKLADEPAAHAVVPITVPTLLAKAAELALMASFLAAAFAYHLDLPEWMVHRLASAMTALNDGVFPDPTSSQTNGLALLVYDFIPGLMAGMPVLELKTTAWLVAAGLLLVIVLASHLWEACMRTPVLPELPPTESASGWALWRRRMPLVCLVGFLAWSLFSFSALGWGPEPPDHVERLSMEVPSTGTVEMPAALGFLTGPATMLRGMWDGMMGRLVETGAGSFHSMVAWLQVLMALVFFVCAEDVIRSRRLVHKVLGLVLGAGIFAAVISLLIQAGAPGISDIWVKWRPGEYRNDIGGIIGHNTAVSSFLMAPMLLGWALFMAYRRRFTVPIQVGLLTGMGLMALVLIMAQSRAVVPILTVAMVSLVLVMARKAALRPPNAVLVGVPLVLAGLLLTQFIDHPANPLYRRSLPLATRLQHMSAEHLVTETRLRIALASARHIGQNLILGSSFGSFQYVYPQVQGEFYQRNPRTRLAPTEKRSFHAHNEYLQTLFETGLVGLALAVAGVWFVLAAGWRVLGGTVRQQHIALQLAVLAAILSLLAHAVFDFPLRVAPLACTLLILLAVWSAGERLWKTPVLPLGKRPGSPVLVSEAMEEVAPPEPTTSRRTQSALAVSWLVAAFLSCAAFVALSSRVMQWWGGKVQVLGAQSLMEHYQSLGGTQDVRSLMVEASQKVSNARRLIPLHGEVAFTEAHLYYMLAVEANQIRQQRWQAGAEDEAEQLRLRTASLGEMSVGAIDRSLLDMRFHGSYGQRAVANYLLSRVYLGEAREQKLEEAINDLRTGVGMNPGDIQGTQNLVNWLERFYPDNEEELLALYDSLRHFHRWYFDDRFLRQALAWDTANQPREMQRRLARFHAVDRDNARYAELYASAAAFAGDLEVTATMEQRLMRSQSPWGPISVAVVLIHQSAHDPDNNGFAARHEAIHDRLERPIDARHVYARRFRDMLQALYEDALDDNRDGSLSERTRERLDAIATSERTIHNNAAKVLLHVLGRPRDAEEMARRALENAGVTERPGMQALIGDCRVYPHRADIQKLLVQAREALDNGEPMPTGVTPELREALRFAIAQFRLASAEATEPFVREILHVRMLEYEMVARLEGGQ